jgi:hypothetical protein
MMNGCVFHMNGQRGDYYVSDEWAPWQIPRSRGCTNFLMGPPRAAKVEKIEVNSDNSFGDDDGKERDELGANIPGMLNPPIAGMWLHFVSRLPYEGVPHFTRKGH